MAVFYKSFAEKTVDRKSQGTSAEPTDATHKFIMATLNRKTKGIILMNELWSDSFYQTVMG